jgi:Glycosyltransferase family 92
LPSEGGPRNRVTSEAMSSKPYLSVCSMYRDHADYLPEWIEFHRLVGVERFFLYDNESTDDHRAVLAPYVEQGIVVVHDWPTPASVERGVPWGLIAAFDDCLARHGDESRWIAFMDIDEFLYAPEGPTVPEVLAAYEQHPGVYVTRLEFGTSGHLRRPSGLVIENYLRRRSYSADDKEWTKSIVDPRRTVKCFNAHIFVYEDAFAVDMDGEPVERPPWGPTPVKLSPLRINHYITKSEEEYRRKLGQWKDHGHALEPGEGWLDLLAGEFDDAITRYVPALREALKRARVTV